MGWLDTLDNPSFAAGQTVYRQRAQLTTSEYSKKSTIDWSLPPSELELPGSFVAQSSTSIATDAPREQALEQKSLYLANPNADVQLTDRIRVGTDVYKITGIPTADTNPFDGWQPFREIPLERAVG